MPYFLNIETATTVCSVSISENEKLLFCKEIDSGFTHAENLHLFIEEGLKQAGITANQLNAIAVSKGPGSYTGLRIGVSTAKGLAYALNLPLISVDTLQVMANFALAQNNKEAFYCPMIDARRMEVYTCVYDSGLNAENTIEALILDDTSVNQFNKFNKIYFFGDGMPKCKDLLSRLPGAEFLENIYPSAKYMPALVYSKYLQNNFEDLAYFEPFYLKDFMILKKKA